MRISTVVIGLSLLLTVPLPTIAAESHGSEIYHAVSIELQTGSSDDGENINEWELEGWIGSDEHKLWLKVEGEREDDVTETAETWLLYSRQVSPFWDMQFGLRHDAQVDSLSYAVLGVHGLAPYFFETDGHVFISEDGDVSARLEMSNELLITQRLVLAPYFELDVFAQDVDELEIGKGFSGAELGFKTYYEISRQVKPYIDLKYEQKLGKTASIAEDNNSFIASIGVEFAF